MENVSDRPFALDPNHHRKQGMINYTRHDTNRGRSGKNLATNDATPQGKAPLVDVDDLWKALLQAH